MDGVTRGKAQRGDGVLMLRGEGKVLSGEAGKQPGPGQEVLKALPGALGSYGQVLSKGVTWT